jgi:hypothetical protein
MSHARIATPHDVSPEAALRAIEDHVGPILLDLDETLYLRNSTEDFIDSARPRLAALLLMKALDVFEPWRWTGGEVTRDVWRVRLITSLLPWTRDRWRLRVTGLARHFANAPLMQALRIPGTLPIITTVGFQPIVAPLVAALGLPDAPIVAARITTCADRRGGKLQLALGALGGDTVRRALVLTDSAQDLALLDACARPLRAIWPDARHHNALSNVYLPGQYLTLVKRPGARYIVRGIVQEDFALWVLSSIALAPLPALHLVGLSFLLVSFWAIYERGYVDNDLVAARFETHPKLSASFRDAPVATPRWQPWYWALGLGAVAIFVLRWPVRPAPTDYVAWVATLLLTHLGFSFYNRCDKATRVWQFAGLQFARTAAFVALVPISAIGASAIGAHVLARWVPYFLYRHEGKDWPEAPFHLIRLLFFVVLAALLALAEGAGTLLNATALMLFAWNLYRAKREIATAWSEASRIDRKPQVPPP